MNIQIFGTKRCFDTKKAERYFKECHIKYQFIDLREEGISRGELTSVVQAVKGLDFSARCPMNNLEKLEISDKIRLSCCKYHGKGE